MVDRYIKLFVALDMIVPRDPRHQRQRKIAQRAADFLSGQFKTVTKEQIHECVRELAKRRNALFHEGLATNDLPGAAQILERIVRAISRRNIGLDDEFAEGDLFKSVAGYKLENQGGFYGWPIPISKA